MSDTEATGNAVFTVPDMTCTHCEKTLRAAFEAAMPGARVRIDLPAHRLEVAGDAKAAHAVIAGAGYRAEPA